MLTSNFYISGLQRGIPNPEKVPMVFAEWRPFDISKELSQSPMC